ncbi:MAG: hypothetical protein WC823_00110 [Parcubacteria group bacterium]|jgi:hypothetical protein
MKTHICVPIDRAIEELQKGNNLFEPATPSEAFRVLIRQKEKGKKYFTGCSNEGPDGMCQGHPDIVDATHKLSCSHCTNSRNRFNYEMSCIVLKKMPQNRVKILVFGERYWNDRNRKERIRYVDSVRVKRIKE